MKIRIAIFFSILFLGLLTTPAILHVIDISKDLSFFLDINEEEEENKGKEESKADSKLKIYPTISATSYLYCPVKSSKNFLFQSENYISYCPKIITPPPPFLS